MSSTNRGKKRAEDDTYLTPASEIVKFLQAVKEDIPGLDEKLGGVVLDPSAGGTAAQPMSYPFAIHSMGWKPTLHTVDIRQDSPAEIHGDYLKMFMPVDWPDVIITNPPFGRAMEFINKGLDEVGSGGYVVMLLRLNFLESAKRREFWKSTMPEYIYVHAKRMSFTPDGKTDSCAYAHMIWREGYYPKHAKIRVI